MGRVGYGRQDGHNWVLWMLPTAQFNKVVAAATKTKPVLANISIYKTELFLTQRYKSGRHRREIYVWSVSWSERGEEFVVLAKIDYKPFWYSTKTVEGVWVLTKKCFTNDVLVGFFFFQLAFLLYICSVEPVTSRLSWFPHCFWVCCLLRH